MHDENKTLIILTPGFPASESDSTCLPMQQSFVRTVQRNFPKLGIIVLSFQYPYFIKKYNWFGATVISFNGQNKGGLARILLRKKLYSALKEINRSNPILGIISFWYGECALVGKTFAAHFGLRHFCWILGQDAKKINKYPRKIIANAGELIALSDFLQDEFEKNHAIRPMHVIPPGVVLKQENVTSGLKDIDILGVGSLIPLKQFEIFIEIVAIIKKEIPGLKVMLVGAGPEKEKLQHLIMHNDLLQSVLLPGELPYEGVLQRMERAKVFLHPSSYEGFSGVCMEALNGGAHVISFCRAMNQEIEHWYIVQNKEEMSIKALAILSNPASAFISIRPFIMEDTVNKIMGLFTL